jgi:hypothetical protein
MRKMGLVDYWGGPFFRAKHVAPPPLISALGPPCLPAPQSKIATFGSFGTAFVFFVIAGLLIAAAFRFGDDISKGKGHIFVSHAQVVLKGKGMMLTHSSVT